MEGEGREKRFIEWFLNNGGLFRGVKQARFEPNSYTGIAADEDIPKNTIVIAVPKNLIIGVERVRGSELGSVLQESPIFGGEDNDDKDFNVLALFLVMEKMKGARSFFAPYLDCIDIAETLVYWPPGDVALLGDPFLTPSFLREVANDFEPTFHTFAEIAERHPALFAERLTRELFDKCYGVVMTRCFGWGLPETMLVPFADLLNHHSNGVHHYAFSASLERRPHPDYVPKGDCLSLALFGIDNARRLPRAYEKDSRELYIEAHRDLLRAKGIPLEGDVRDLPNATARQCLQAIRSHRARESFEAPLLLSSDSEDNDSLEDEDEAVLEQIKDNPHARRFYEAKTHFRRMR